MLGGSLNINMPTYFLKNLDSIEVAGTYSTLVYVLLMIRMVIEALGQASIKTLSEYHEESDRNKFRSLVDSLSLLSLIVGCVAFLVSFMWGGEILGMIFGPRFLDFGFELSLIMLAALFNFQAIVFNTALTAKRLQRKMLINNIVAITVGILACTFLVPKFALTGAILGLVATMTSLALLAFIRLYHADLSVT